MGVIGLILGFLHAVLLPRTALIAENLTLRQQLAVLQVSVKRPKLRKRDRVFWVWLALVPHDREARDGRPLASRGLQAVLALEVAEEARTAGD